MTQKNSFNAFDNIKLFQIINKWKWHIIIITLAAIVAGVVMSKLILKPKYKSTCLVYPSNVRPYSDESETAQIMQWLNAQLVRDSVINELNLGEHYGLNPKDKEYKGTLEYLYGKRVKISKTMLESVSIVVIDNDPEMPKKIIESILKYTNILVRKAQAAKFMEVVDAYKFSMQKKKTEIDSITNLISGIANEYGIYDVESQSKEITRGLLRGSTNPSELKKMSEGMKLKGGELIYLKSRFENLDLEYSELAQKYDQARVDAERPFTFVNMIDAPQVPETKFFPKTSLMIVYFLLSSWLFTLIAIAIIEFRKNIAEKATEK